MKSVKIFTFLLIAGFVFGLTSLLSDQMLSTANVFAADIDAIDAPVEEPAVNAPVAAAAPAPTDDVPISRPPNYLVWMIKSCGWFFTPVFLVMSIITVAFFVMCIITIRRDNLLPKEFVEQFTGLLDGKKYQEAFELAKENESMIGKIFAAGLSKMSAGYDRSVQAMQDVGEQETLKIDSQLKVIAMMGSISPMVGLFGTVVGMISSFQEIASSVSTPPAYKLAEGIATALFTTEIGLAIAIPALIFYEIMKNRLTIYVLEISIISDSLMGRFKK